MTNKFKLGLISASVMTLVACGGGGGGGGNKPSTPASSAAPVSSSSSSESSVASSTPATSSSSSVVEASSSSVASSSVVSSSSSSMDSSSSLSSSSSSSSSSAAAVTTEFTVKITSPDLDDGAALAKTGRSAKAQKSEELLARDQLAVVVVDVAGNVVKTIPLDETNSTLNADGSWSIRVPGYPQLDCIVIADLNGPITVFQPGDNVFDSDLLLTPTTGEDLEVSLASTAAYQNFLDSLGGEGTFADLNLDVNDPTQLSVLQNLIETVADVLDSQVFVGATSITQALAQVQQQVAGIVQVEATNITSSLDPATNTLATGLQAGGIYWFESYEPSEVFYGGFPELNATEQERYFDGESFQLRPEYEIGGDLVLTSSGWIVSNDMFQASAVNADGSVTLNAADAPTNSINAKATQVFNLAGRNIPGFFGAYGDTRGLVSLIDPTSTFAEGALGYRIRLQSTNDVYTLWYNPGYNYFGNGVVCPWDRNNDGQANDSPETYGGNCEIVNNTFWNEQGLAQTSQPLNSLTQLMSPDLAPGAVGAQIVSIEWASNGVIGVQLLNDANKTANYYRHNWSDNTQTLLGSSTWSQETLPYLQGNTANAISFIVPKAIAEQADLDTDERHIVFAVHNGWVRRGEKASEGEVISVNWLFFNNTAKSNLLAAFDYEPAIVGTWNIGGDYLMFKKGGTFAQVKVSNDDPNCQVGMAFGEYSWNAATGAFSLELDSDTTAVEEGDSCSALGVETITISGSSMTMTEGEDTFVLTKVTPSESAPLAGAWAVSGSGDWFTFTADNSFIHAKIEKDDPNCQIGWANGSFSWNAETGLLSATVDQDYTDEFPDSTCTLEGDITATLDGNTLSFSADDDNFTMKRFGNPLN